MTDSDSDTKSSRYKINDTQPDLVDDDPIVGNQAQFDSKVLPDPPEIEPMSEYQKAMKLKSYEAETKDNLTSIKNDPKENGSLFSGMKNKIKGIFNLSSSGNPITSKQASMYSSGQPAEDKNMIMATEDENDDMLYQQYYKYGLLHDELIFLSQITVPDTPSNREWLYRKSDTSQVIHRLITMTIVGSGIHILSDNSEIKEALDELFDNLRGPYQDYNIVDLTADIMRDNMVHGMHLSAVTSNDYISLEDAYDIPLTSEETTPNPVENKVNRGPGRPPKGSKKQAVQTHRLDMRSIQKVTHPTTGAIKFIQDVYTYGDIPTVKKFYSKDYNPTFRTGLGVSVQPDTQQRKVINIKPEQVVYVNLFREAPFSTVLDLVTHRTWLLWAQKKVGLKFAAPVPVVKLTDQGDNVDDDPVSRESTMSSIAAQLSSIRFGDAIVLDVDQEWVGESVASGGNQGFSFNEVIDAYDQKIALALGSSMALFEASGSELATSRTIQDTFLRFISGIRAKLERAYKLLAYRHLKAMNIEFGKREFSFKWSPLRDRMLSEVINAIVNFWNSGLVQSMEEARALADGVFDMEELDSTEDKTYMEILEEKEYVAAKGRGKAEIETQEQMMELEKKHQEEIMKLQQKYEPPESQSGSNSSDSGGKSSKSRAVDSNKEDQQGSLSSTGAQPGDRKPGPQGDQGQQSVTERDKQLPGN